MSDNILRSRLYCRNCQIKQLHELVMNQDNQPLKYVETKKKKVKHRHNQDITELDAAKEVSLAASNSIHEEVECLFYDKYVIVKCRGCGETVSFVKMTTNELAIESVEEGKDPYTYKIYPEPPRRKYRLQGKYSFQHVPQWIKELRNEVVRAFEQGAILLSLAGLRMVTEAICKQHIDIISSGIDSNIEPIPNNLSLQKMIDILLDHNIITKPHHVILQKVRVLGNKAVHQFTSQDRDLIHIAIEVLDNLLYNVFDLEQSKLAQNDNFTF
ncbi:DUF4145 domain-containing protein [Risungbinella massiliensis]|uniref:DUF4145 domain-containing protein n=1 Tax=Risungbinella massiliensis TaxID=1329796 RepID=UPI0005CC8884|nr:DUF4145 domain-containing protein [Risungbinella massiliensis]